MFHRTFTFGQKKEVTKDTLYDSLKGYGFLDQRHIPGETKSEQSLYNGGWNPRAPFLPEWAESFDNSPSEEGGVLITKERSVLIFKADVPSYGVYHITVKYHAAEDMTGMSLFSGRRNLLNRDISLKKDQTYSRSFYTHVTPYIPAMTSVPCGEKAVYISVSGLHAGLTELTIDTAKAPTLFIAGDSTLTDQNALYPYYPYGSCGGWAQVMSRYFENVAVCNQAHSGLTTNCFRDDGHWQIVKDHIKEGDIFMLQFGHNDQKRRNLASFGGYSDNLRWYVKEIRAMKAIPVILSPISRIPMEDNGKMRSLLAEHSLACKVCADECGVPFIDLHDLTFRLWCELGEKAKDYFMNGDITHTNDFGACTIADFVIREIRRQGIEPLASLSLPPVCELPAPAVPENVLSQMQTETRNIPSEPSDGGMFRIALPYMDVTDETQRIHMTEALRKGLLDPCVMHLHPDEPLPRAQFLMIYFKALRIAGKRPYLGKFCDMSRYEWDSSYVQTCVEENLIDPVTVPDDRFRPDDMLTVEEFASFVIRGTKSGADLRDIPLADCMREAVKERLIPLSKKEKDTMTRAEIYHGLVLLMELLDNAGKALPSDSEIHPVG